MESFTNLLTGHFNGMIRLPMVEQLQNKMASIDGWYLVEPGSDLPESTVAGEHAARHFQSLVDEIMRLEKGVWTTLVYAHEAEEPKMVKVYHPLRAGCGCGPSVGVKPWWVFSRVPPEKVSAWQESAYAVPAKPSGWLARWMP